MRFLTKLWASLPRPNMVAPFRTCLYMSLSLLRIVVRTVLWLCLLPSAVASLLYLSANLLILLGSGPFLVRVLLTRLSRPTRWLGRTNSFRVLTRLTGLRPIG